MLSRCALGPIHVIVGSSGLEVGGQGQWAAAVSINLLDTNIVAEPLRPKPADSIMRRLDKHEGEMAIPALVWHELRYGCARLKRSPPHGSRAVPRRCRVCELPHSGLRPAAPILKYTLWYNDGDYPKESSQVVDQ